MKRRGERPPRVELGLDGAALEDRVHAVLSRAFRGAANARFETA